MRFLYAIINYRLLFVLISFWPMLSQAGDILYGKDIKYQASKFFKEIGITGEILTSDRRAFFSCTEGLEFSPHVQNDWRTVRAKCKSQNWQSILRTTAVAPNDTFEKRQGVSSSSQVVSIVSNMSRDKSLAKKI